MSVSCLLWAAGAYAQGPSPILLEHRQRDIVLVRHLRHHIADPADGLALAADQRDLQRLRAGPLRAVAAPLSPAATDDELIDSLRVLVDLWHARVVERTPFGRMSREGLTGLTQAQRAMGQLQSRGSRPALDLWLPRVEEELSALLRAVTGQGDLTDAAIDEALQLADAAATGRPSGGTPPPPVGSPAPYTLPPGYEAYREASAAGAGGPVACQALRAAAGVSQLVSDMIRAAECWTRTPTWPGWGVQTLEALDWAASLAAIERNCAALAAAIDSLRETGPRLKAGGLAGSVSALAQSAESDRRWLRGQSLCR